MATLGDTTVVSLNVLNGISATTISTSGTITATGNISTSGTLSEGSTLLSNKYIAKSLTTTKGDIIYASAANTPARLAIGSNGQFLSIASGVPTWVNNPNTDTDKKTASSNNDAKLFLIGAAAQSTDGQATYSNTNIYMKAGTAYFAKTQDLSGTADNRPALVVGGGLDANGNLSGAHMEFDANEIHAKATATTTAPLYLNHEGSNTYFSGEKTYSDGTYLYSNNTQVLTTHQNEYGKIKVGSTTTTADAVQDTIEFAGSGATSVSISGDKITISSTDNDTKNTAGSTNTTNKLYLIGANTQAANPQTYSNQYLFYENNELNIGGVKISTDSMASSGTQLTLRVTDTNDSGDRVTAVHICTDYDDNNNFIGTSVIARGRFVAYGDDDGSNPNKPIDQTNSDDLDTDYFNTGITLRGDETYKLSFPAKSGIIGTQIDIVDLTSLS